MCGISGQKKNQTSAQTVKVGGGIRKEKLTQKRLKEILEYNLTTGVFTYRVRRGKMKVDDIAGGFHKTTGYIEIKIDGALYLAHRLVFLYMDGYFPEHEVDHKNGIKTDNRWSELRHATPSCNRQNQKINTGNTSGFPGVTWAKQYLKWQSQIKINKKNILIGRFPELIDAALARFTVEMQCDKWKCNYRSELTRLIKKSWPEFKYG